MNEARSYAPLIFRLSRAKDRRLIAQLVRAKKILWQVDELGEQKKELMMVRYPKRISHALLFSAQGVPPTSDKEGAWVFYPWQAALVHILAPAAFETLRMSRNKNLITAGEQKKFRKAIVGIAGLNVGNPAALCIALEGGASRMKLADHDVLSLSNLNRFRASLRDLGLNKAILSARQIYEINPFAQLKVYPKGIVPGREEEFLLKPKLSVLVEEMDNMKLKISIREKARRFRIPVVMVTGNGPNVIIDVERFDKNPRLPLLNGYLNAGAKRALMGPEAGKGTFRERVLLARDFMGARFLHERLRKSFLLVGMNLAGIPQLAESSFLRGAAVSYVARQIVTGKPMPSGRYFLNLDKAFH